MELKGTLCVAGIFGHEHVNPFNGIESVGPLQLLFYGDYLNPFNGIESNMLSSRL